MNSIWICEFTTKVDRTLVHCWSPHDITSAGPVMQDDNVKVTCAGVDHPPIKMALAYRFDTANRPVVFSGGTRKTDSLNALVKAADILVCEGQYLPGIRGLAARQAGREFTATLDEGVQILLAPRRFRRIPIVSTSDPELPVRVKDGDPASARDASASPQQADIHHSNHSPLCMLTIS
jgi:hypothetical protein